MWRTRSRPRRALPRTAIANHHPYAIVLNSYYFPTLHGRVAHVAHRMWIRVAILAFTTRVHMRLHQQRCAPRHVSAWRYIRPDSLTRTPTVPSHSLHISLPLHNRCPSSLGNMRATTGVDWRTRSHRCSCVIANVNNDHHVLALLTLHTWHALFAAARRPCPCSNHAIATADRKHSASSTPQPTAHHAQHLLHSASRPPRRKISGPPLHNIRLHSTGANVLADTGGYGYVIIHTYIHTYIQHFHDLTA